MSDAHVATLPCAVTLKEQAALGEVGGVGEVHVGAAKELMAKFSFDNFFNSLSRVCRSARTITESLCFLHGELGEGVMHGNFDRFAAHCRVQT